MAKRDVRAEINDRLITALENGVIPWRKPWVADPNAGTPVNIVSQKRYRGVNTLLTELTAIEKGYSSRWWGTFKQWKDKGCSVKKGEKSTQIIYYHFRDAENENEDERSNDGKSFAFARGYRVFNADQVTGENIDKWKVDEQQEELRQEWDNVPLADAVVDATGAIINHGGNRACYSPNADTVQMPNLGQFSCAADYYDTLFHELAHWSESRIGFSKSFDRKDRIYALGELFAEIAGCYVCNELGIPADEKNNAAYLQHWLEDLKAEKGLIIRVAKWASKSADFLLGGRVENETVNHRELIAG